MMDDSMVDLYRSAGEFYGRLREELKFGDLSMRRDGRAFFLQWRFSARGKEYGRQFAIRAVELSCSRALPKLAEHVARQWKSGGGE